VSMLFAALCIAAAPAGPGGWYGAVPAQVAGFNDITAADQAAMMSQLQATSGQQGTFSFAGNRSTPFGVRPASYAQGATRSVSRRSSLSQCGPEGCGDAGCGAEDCFDAGCEGCGGCEPAPCGPTWVVFGEFLFLRPRDAEIAYAVAMNGPQTSPPAVPIQVSPIAVVDPEYEPGFRVGYELVFDDCTSLGVTYTRYESETSDSIETVPYVIRSMVSHPSSFSGTSDGLTANARYYMDFALVDADVRGVISCGPRHLINWVAGGRYATSEHRFQSQFAVNGRETVMTSIDFQGAGLRAGLEAERHARCNGWMVYGKGTANFVAGEFQAEYAQGQAFDASVVGTRWTAGRIVSMLEMELGAGWTSKNGCFRATAGYLVSAWFNTVMTDEFIHAVQTNNFIDLGDTLTFDGLVARAEIRF